VRDLCNTFDYLIFEVLIADFHLETSFLVIYLLNNFKLVEAFLSS